MAWAHLASAFRSAVWVLLLNPVRLLFVHGQPECCLLCRLATWAWQCRLPFTLEDGDLGVVVVARLEHSHVPTILQARLVAQLQLVNDAIVLHPLHGHSRRAAAQTRAAGGGAYLRFLTLSSPV